MAGPSSTTELVTLSSHFSCGPTPIQGVWFRQSYCPEAQETDAIQLATDHILDAADDMHKTGLVAAGYSLLAVANCASLAHPSHRTSIMEYVEARGLSIVFVDPAPGVGAAEVLDALRAAHDAEPFVHVTADQPRTQDVMGTNHCHVTAADAFGQVVVTSAIDNLVKGAAGQAVQNMNVVLGFDETWGLA